MHNVFIRASDYCDSNQLMQLYDGHRNVLSWDVDFDVLHFLTKLCWLHSNISKIGDCFSKSTMISMMKKSSWKGSLQHLDARSCIYLFIEFQLIIECFFFLLSFFLSDFVEMIKKLLTRITLNILQVGNVGIYNCNIYSYISRMIKLVGM